jgi:hypothetical protein
MNSRLWEISKIIFVTSHLLNNVLFLNFRAYLKTIKAEKNNKIQFFLIKNK